MLKFTFNLDYANTLRERLNNRLLTTLCSVHTTCCFQMCVDRSMRNPLELCVTLRSHRLKEGKSIVKGSWHFEQDYLFLLLDTSPRSAFITKQNST